MTVGSRICYSVSAPKIIHTLKGLNTVSAPVFWLRAEKFQIKTIKYANLYRISFREIAPPILLMRG